LLLVPFRPKRVPPRLLDARRRLLSAVGAAFAAGVVANLAGP
jgi:hypothetical protein